MTHSFPKEARLRKQPEFDAVYAGRKKGGQHVVVHSIMTEDPDTKAGFVVSKRVSKRAVVRNQVKRRLREIFRKHREELPKGMHLIIRALPSAAFASFNELAHDVENVFHRIAP